MDVAIRSASSVLMPGVFQRERPTASTAVRETEKIAPRWMRETSFAPDETKS